VEDLESVDRRSRTLGKQSLRKTRRSRRMADFIFTDLDDLKVQAMTSSSKSTKNESHVKSISIESQPGSETGREDLQNVGLLEFLDIDERPVFILDLKSLTRNHPVYYNATLRSIPHLELKISKGTTAVTDIAARDPKHSAFLDWAVSSKRDGSGLDRSYCGLLWSAKTIQGRWRIISSNTVNQELEMNSTRRQSELPRIGRVQTLRPERIGPSIHTDSIDSQLAAFRLHRDELIQTFPSVKVREPLLRRPDAPGALHFDFTRPNPTISLSPHLQFVLNFDWASTELGPISHWDTDLRRMANIVMNDPRPAAMYWGKSRTILYNEPYVMVTGQRHPRMMGKSFEDAWEEVAGDFTPLFDKAYETGASYEQNDARFYIERHGYLEETYYSISIIPFNTSNGGVAL
jgi:hypothetical protein